MSITAYNQTRIGSISRIEVTSSLTGTIYYHWYIDGLHIASGQSPVYVLYLSENDQAEVVCQDTNDAAYDALANAPAGYPARRTLHWVRSIDADVDHYRVDQKLGGGDWSALATVPQDSSTWYHAHLTGRLDDLGVYTWRIVPIDAAGNAGTPTTIGPETIVRTPDAPNYTIAFAAGTTLVTFTAA